MENLYLIGLVLLSVILLLVSKTVNCSPHNVAKSFKSRKNIKKQITKFLKSGSSIIVSFSVFATGCFLLGYAEKGTNYCSDICFAISLLLYLSYAFFAGKDIGDAIKFLLSVLNTVFSLTLWLFVMSIVKHSKNISVPVFVWLVFLTVSGSLSVFDVWTGTIEFVKNLYGKNKKNTEIINSVFGVAVSLATLMQMAYSLFRLINFSKP